MDDGLNAIVDIAKSLGTALQESSVFQELKKIHETLRNDTVALELLDKHQELFTRVRNLEMENKPIEPEDKRLLLDAQEQLHANTVLQEYARIQADFQQLMNVVISEIHVPIDLPPLQDEESDSKENE